jgi:hypothetical protein
LCPLADLFRSTPFPEIREKSAQKDYLFTNLIENRGIVKQFERFQTKTQIELFRLLMNIPVSKTKSWEGIV